ncbi:MAG: hypothetical protein KDD67_02550 [Ignavibacteriae bacterium]|nr:hypothetical protein [Ignavibacteriota bacterium]MCB9216920.1 hypothetical protein [Ignavibacteria bacterium]
MSTVLCFYHSPCNDGASAAAALTYRLQKSDPSRVVECHPMGFTVEWNDPLDEHYLKSLGHSHEKVSAIYIVDISISPEKYHQILAFLKGAGRIGEEKPRTICIDHHRTALDNLEILQEYCDETLIEIGPGLSGATLVWKYFNSTEGELSIPTMLRYVADQDVWEWKLPFSKEINSALNTLDGVAATMVAELARSIEDEQNWFEKRKSQGEAILSVIESQLHKSYSRIFECDDRDGTEYRVVNATENASELGNMLCEESSKSPNVIAVIYSIQKNWSVKVSLRSIPGGKINARQVAERFGGGGHDHAAGCRFPDMMAFDRGLEELLGVDVKLIVDPVQAG